MTERTPSRRSSAQGRSGSGRARRSRLRLYLIAAGILVFGVVLMVGGTILLGRLLSADRQAAAGEDLPPAPTALPAGPLDYVALGDSYAAGPGLLPTRTDPAACDRSRNDYPAYLAQWLSVRTYVDVSCTGAASPDITGSQVRVDGTSVPPQINAVTPGADLITITLGGNDRGAFQRMVDECPDDPRCFERLDALGVESPQSTVAGLADRTVTTIETVRAAAPQALVVLVGYLPVFPSDGDGCDQLGFTGKALVRGREYSDDVAAALADAAARTGVMFVDMRVAGAGHDVCGQEPWVAGRSGLSEPTRIWHPYEAGMRGVAAEVLERLGRGPAPAGDAPAQPPAGSVVLNPSDAS